MANYYMQGGDGKEYGPVSAEQLRQWAAEGRANAQTQVRATDGVGYVAFGTVPELTGLVPASIPAPRPVIVPQTTFFTQSPGAEDTEASAQTKRLAAVVAAGSVWMKLLAVAMFLLALLLSISIVGLIVAWLPLWQGINLWGAANLAQQAVYTGSEHDLQQSLDKIRRSFTIGFFLIVALGLFYLVGTVIGLMMGGMGALHGLGGTGSL
jgi:hypothetical protein